MIDFNTCICHIEFENNVTFPEYFSAKNPAHIQRWINDNQDLKDISLLSDLLNEHENEETLVSNDNMKDVFKMLKNRELHPKGYFDKQGRFYLEDKELVDVRAPSVKYPYSQMVAGRTSKFVKKIAEKYRCKNKNELIACFKSN